MPILLEFEVNRIDVFWYGDEPRLDFEGCRKLLAKLPLVLKEKIEDHLAKLQKTGIKSPVDSPGGQDRRKQVVRTSQSALP